MQNNGKEFRKIYFLQKHRPQWLIRLMEFLQKDEIDLAMDCLHFTSMQEMFESWLRKEQEPVVIVLGTGIGVHTKLKFLKKYRSIEEKKAVEIICLYRNPLEEAKIRLGIGAEAYNARIKNWYDGGKPKSWELISSSLFVNNFDVQVSSILKTFWKTMDLRLIEDNRRKARVEIEKLLSELEQQNQESNDLPQITHKIFETIKYELNRSYLNPNSQRYQILNQKTPALTPTEEIILKAWSKKEKIKSIQKFLEKKGIHLKEGSIRKHLRNINQKLENSPVLKIAIAEKSRNPSVKKSKV